jgi:hypothetical protein
MDNNKLTNIVLTGGIIIFIVLGTISLQLNYLGLENQEVILEKQNIAAQERAAIQDDNTQFFKEHVLSIHDKLDIIMNKTN